MRPDAIPGWVGDEVTADMNSLNAWDRRAPFVEPDGRLIISAYTDPDESVRDLFGDLTSYGHEPTGRILVERPGRNPLITAWLDA